MLGLDAAFVSLALMLGLPAERPTVTAEEFRGWFADASRGGLRIPEPVARRAKGFRYVFVGGFRVGRMPGYFAQNAQELRSLGVPRKSIHFVFPSSHQTLEENCGTVRDELLRIADEGPERLVIVAHSRGACDALAFALHEPEFVRDHVEAFFLIQGPFGGTGLADYVLGEGEEMDEQMPPGHRMLARWIGAFERYLLGRGKHAGLAGLTREASRAYWELAMEAHAGAVPVVGPKVFYVEANVRPSRLGLLMRSMAWYLGSYYGPNDGVVALGDQTVPGLGTSLGILEAGHADLTRRYPASHAGRRSRRALIRSIVMVVGRTAAPSSQHPTTGASGSRDVARRRKSAAGSQID